jgi:hypothetical protein
MPPSGQRRECPLAASRHRAWRESLPFRRRHASSTESRVLTYSGKDRLPSQRTFPNAGPCRGSGASAYCDDIGGQIVSGSLSSPQTGASPAQKYWSSTRLPNLIRTTRKHSGPHAMPLRPCADRRCHPQHPRPPSSPRNARARARQTFRCVNRSHISKNLNRSYEDPTPVSPRPEFASSPPGSEPDACPAESMRCCTQRA